MLTDEFRSVQLGSWFKCRESSQITSAYLSGIASAAAKDINQMGATKPIRIWIFFGLKKHFTSSHTLTTRESKSHTGYIWLLIKKQGALKNKKRISWTHDLFWVSKCWNFSSLEPSCEGLPLPLWKKQKSTRNQQIVQNLFPTNCAKSHFNISDGKRCRIITIADGQPPPIWAYQQCVKPQFCDVHVSNGQPPGTGNPEMPLDVGCKQI